jgi:hypothetical protein
MAEPQPEEQIYQQMRTILKPMINTALSEKPKDPVNENIINI